MLGSAFEELFLQSSESLLGRIAYLEPTSLNVLEAGGNGKKKL